jgi:hypothetical protein
MSKIKLNKVEVKVINKVEKKIDKRTLNTGRPVNKTSARQLRLAQQSWYETINAKFVNGNGFKISAEDNSTYKYSAGKDNSLGCIVNAITGHECNVSYIGRTKVQGYKFVLGKKVNVELNLKTLKFTK